MKRANIFLTVLYLVNSLIVMMVFSTVLTTTYTIEIDDFVLNIVLLAAVSIVLSLVFYLLNPVQLEGIRTLLDERYDDSSMRKLDLLVTYPLRAIPVFATVWLAGMVLYLLAGGLTHIIKAHAMPLGFLFSVLFVIVLGIVSQTYSFKIATNAYISRAIKKLKVMELKSIYIPIKYKIIGISSMVIVSAYLVLVYSAYNGAMIYVGHDVYSNTLRTASGIAYTMDNSADPESILKGLSGRFGGKYNFYLYDMVDKSVKSYSDAQLNGDVVRQLDREDVVYDKRNNQVLFLVNRPVTINGKSYRLLAGINRDFFNAPLRGFLYNLILSGILILIVLIITDMLISNDISSHEKSLSDYSVMLSNKELTHLPEIVSTDEIGVIVSNIRMLVMNFRDSMLRISKDIDSMSGVATSTSSGISGIKSAIAEQSKYTDELVGIIRSVKGVSEQIIKGSAPLNEATANNGRLVVQALQKNKELTVYLNSVSYQIARISALLTGNITVYEDIRNNIIKLSDIVASIGTASGEIDAGTSAMNTLLARFSESVNTIRTLNTRAAEFKKDIEALLSEVISITDNVLTLLSAFLSHIQQANEMLGIINNIAERTNLLSVNAFILAASHQTEGKNFKVVAEEIKKLADRARTGSRDVSNYITRVRRNVDEILTGMKDMNSFILLTRQSFSSINSIEAKVDELAASAIDLYGDRAGRAVSPVDRETLHNHGAAVGGSVRALVDDISSAVSSMSDINNAFTGIKSSLERMSGINEADNASLTAINHSVEDIKTFTGYINDSLAVDVSNQIQLSQNSAMELSGRIKDNEQTIHGLEGIVGQLTSELESLNRAIKSFIV
ncbi:MAG: methyl-accepting chemotaxis protein [Deltaproteobacteria bacterium]|nr:methyl-accepting chemotaxis protein [Deltaproteobacteria bacterium]MCL5276370.1 methyl-accepting chemotaxis protein [Deltaproteobacteria bacterium]